jgi:hypothetical protein
MPRDREYWQRHEEYQRTGVWPPTQKQVAAADAPKRQQRVNISSQRAAAGINPNVSAELAREILDWHKNNPDAASYDNDGNPVEHE